SAQRARRLGAPRPSAPSAATRSAAGAVFAQARAASRRQRRGGARIRRARRGHQATVRPLRRRTALLQPLAGPARPTGQGVRRGRGSDRPRAGAARRRAAARHAPHLQRQHLTEDGVIRVERDERYMLAQAFAYCERLARTHYENYPVASVLVPERLRPYL